MRRLVVALLFALSLGLAGEVALAQTPIDPGVDRAMESITTEAQRERTRPRRPSGFWTGTRPAKNGAYRWRLLGIGVVIVCVSTFLTVRFIRKQSRVDVAAE